MADLKRIADLSVKDGFGPFYTVEQFATTLRAKKELVDQCFALLNREGLLSQALNTRPGRWGKRGMWRRTVYRVLRKDKK